MYKKSRICVLAMFAAIAFTLVCTINEDNGNPASPGEGGGNQSPGGGALVPSIDVESLPILSVGATDTLRFTFYADTSKSAVRTGATVYITDNSGEGELEVGRTSVVTDASGRGKVTVKALAEGNYTVTFTSGNARAGTANITVTSGPLPRNMILTASHTTLDANGTSKSTITAQVWDHNRNPIVGDVITFSSTEAGFVTAEATTNSEGKAVATLTSERRNDTTEVIARLRGIAIPDQRVRIIFTGVTLNVIPNPPTIKPNGTDSTVVVAKLLDANNIPIVGDTVIWGVHGGGGTMVFRGLDAVEDGRGVLSVTNNLGEVRAVVKKNGGVSEPGWIEARAAGAQGGTEIRFSERNMKVRRVDGDGSSLLVGESSCYVAEYRNGSGGAIGDEQILVAVTAGRRLAEDGDPDPSNSIFAQHFKTDQSGDVKFCINNPTFTGEATVYARGGTVYEPIEDTIIVNFIAGRVRRIEITGTPAVIQVGGGRAKITATAFDQPVGGNRVNGATIAFNIKAGPGGGEHIEKPLVVTGQHSPAGVAEAYLVSGSIPSRFEGVEIEASEVGGGNLTSPPVKFTIAGLASDLLLVVADPMGGENPDAINVYEATFGLNVSAIVPDINGNPVADGTDVTFGAIVDSGVVLIGRTAKTVKGIANNELIYGQSEIGTWVRIYAEVNGIHRFREVKLVNPLGHIDIEPPPPPPPPLDDKYALNVSVNGPYAYDVGGNPVNLPGSSFVISGPSGGLPENRNVRLDPGTAVVLMAEDFCGWRFERWTSDPEGYAGNSTSKSINFVLNGDVSVVANYRPVPTATDPLCQQSPPPTPPPAEPAPPLKRAAANRIGGGR